MAGNYTTYNVGHEQGGNNEATSGGIEEGSESCGESQVTSCREGSSGEGGERGRRYLAGTCNSHGDEVANCNCAGAEPSRLISTAPPRPRRNSPKHAHEILGKYAVYRIFNHSGELIYVGATRSFKYRMDNHSGSQPWRKEIDPDQTIAEWFDSVEAASARESFIIATESPKHNVHGKPGNTPSRYRPIAERVSPMCGMTLDQMREYLMKIDAEFEN